MDKSKTPGVSKLKQPNTMLPLPKVKVATSKILQPLSQNKVQENPARRILTRRSKSFSDLRLHSKITEPFKKTFGTGMSVASKHLLTSTSTIDLHNKLKRPLLNGGLKTIPESSSSKVVTKQHAATSTTRIATKRTATNSTDDNAASRPKVPKPAKPAAYDYKARFNLLSEKHTNLVQTHKETKQKLVDVEKDLEEYQNLKATNLQLQRNYANILNEKSKIQEKHEENTAKLLKLDDDFKQLNEDHQQLQSDHELLKIDHFQNKTKIDKLEEKNDCLNGDLANLRTEHEKLQSDYAALQDTYEKLYKNYTCLQKTKDSLESNLNDANGEIDSLQKELHEYKTCLQSHEKLRRVMHNQIQDLKGTIRVFCRVRPNMPQENDRMLCNISYVDEATLEIKKCKESINLISGKINDLKLEFNFDKVFPPEATQVEIFEELAQLVQSALDGYHVCVFAYGQTGSGKTYTMQGEESPKYLGMIPRTIDLIFNLINNLNKVGWTYTVEASFLEIYNENIKDLLDKDNKEHHDIRFNEGKGTTVTNLTIRKVESAEQLKQLMGFANRNRAVATTNFNEHSSRSHAVTKITLTGLNEEIQVSYEGSLSLVDLAGSESAKTSTSERITETKNINKSLSTLGTVMSALHNKENHIPYRNSKLTYLLQSSLGGNSKTLMFVNIAPFEECYNESVNALRFAAKVKEVKIGSKRNKAYLQRELSNVSK